MNRIHSLKELDRLGDTWVGVFLQPIQDCYTGQHRAWHVGMLYRIDSGPIEGIHLDGHLEPIRMNKTPRSGWLIELKLDVIEITVLIIWFRLVIFESNDKVQYGFSAAKDEWFDEGGRYKARPIGGGLNCITFVQALLAAKGYPLLKVDEWPARLDDDVARIKYRDMWASMASLLDAERASQYDSICSQPTENRCRILELVAGVCSARRPISYRHACRSSGLLRNCIERHGSNVNDL